MSRAMFAMALSFPQIGPDLISFEIGGFTLAIRYYALAYIIGLLIGWWLALRALKRPGLWPNGEAPLSPERLEEFLTWIILGVLLGGRLGYVLFYVLVKTPEDLAADPLMVFRVWDGGMSFHGGFLGVVLATYFFARKHNIILPHLSDLLAMATAPGLLLGRIANFINAELWGRPTDLPWGVIFPGRAAQDCPGIEPGLCARHPSQLYEAGMEGLILGALLLWLAFGRGAFKRPWLLTGVFFAGYGIARFLVELVRQADAQFITLENPMGYVVQFGSFGLSMGQLLSLPMILIGLWLILKSRSARA